MGTWYWSLGPIFWKHSSLISRSSSHCSRSSSLDAHHIDLSFSSGTSFRTRQIIEHGWKIAKKITTRRWTVWWNSFHDHQTCYCRNSFPLHARSTFSEVSKQRNMDNSFVLIRNSVHQTFCRNSCLLHAWSTFAEMSKRNMDNSCVAISHSVHMIFILNSLPINSSSRLSVLEGLAAKTAEPWYQSSELQLWILSMYSAHLSYNVIQSSQLRVAFVQTSG